MRLFNNIYMELALKNAKLAFKKNEIPVGAVIVDNNSREVISQAYNKVIQLSNPCAHAEILAITKACKKANSYQLNHHSIYITLEPCPMCAGAILNSKIPHIFFGAYNKKYGAIETKLQTFENKFPHKPEIYGGIYEKESQEIMKLFFKNKRI